MMKVVALLTRKTDVPREQFIEHYENTHVPLILRSFPQIREYRRNFVDLAGVILAPGVAEPSFDVITEMWFDDRDGYEGMLAAHADPAIGGPVAADANLFLDMSKTIQFVVDVREGPGDGSVAPAE